MREGGPVRKEAYKPESETLKTHEIHEVSDDQILGEALPPKLPERVKDEDIIGEALPPKLPERVKDADIIGEALPPKLPERVKDEDIIGEVLPPPLRKKSAPSGINPKTGLPELPIINKKEVEEITDEDIIGEAEPEPKSNWFGKVFGKIFRKN